ncbi:MAG: PAS domain S-box protein [Pseudomonadota bacterium]
MTLRRLFQTSLKIRMTMLVVLLVLAATMTVTSVALSLVEQDMRTVIGDQQFARLSGTVRTLDEQLRARQSELRSLAENLPEAARASPGALQAFLATRHNLHKQFSNISAFDMRGTLVASLRPINGKPAFRVNQRPYFIDTVASGAGVISAPLKSAVSGNPVLLMTQPVFDDAKQMVFIIAASFDLNDSNLFDEVIASHPGKLGYNYVMTSKGILIQHPDRSRLLEHINAKPGVNPATQRALAGFEGWIEAPNKEASLGIYSYKRMKTTDWIVASRFPSDEAFAPIRLLRLRVLLASALLAMLAGLVGWLVTRRALAPLERLRSQALLVREGARDISELQLDRDDEIGELSHAIYALMAQREAGLARIVASEALTRAILERAPDAFVSCDSTGVILEWNERAADSFGWSRQEAIGRNIAELIIPQAMHAAHHAGMAAFARSGTGPIVNSRIRVQACHRDGRTIPVELSVGSLPHGDSHIATAFLHDVTERIAFEEAIAAGEKRARMIADAMPAMISYVDREQRYRFVNASHRAYLGIDPASMIGRLVSEVLDANTFALLYEPMRQALAGTLVRTEVSRIGVAGVEYFMAHLIPDFDAAGQVVGCYGMVMDISERKGAELRQAASERRAEAANLAKTEFVANISHEIRTPLNAVLGISHLLGKTTLLPEQRHYLDMVRTSGTALLTILNDVLDFSKIEAGRMELSHATFELADVLDAIATIMTVNAGEKALELSIGVAPSVPSRLCGDALRLQQVLINLVGNAIKFTQSGAVRLEVDQIGREGERSTLRFAVHDTGIGISAEQQENLFSAFSQADASTTRRFGGTGLGLAICRRLTDLMQGTLELSSSTCQGSTFTLELALQAAPQGAAPLAFQRLLVVAGRAETHHYACWLAAGWGWEADSAASMAQAQACIARQAAAGAPYSVLLFDWEMPGQAPEAALQQLVAANGDSPLHVLLKMSTRARGQYVQRDVAMESSMTVLKPVSAAAILDALAATDTGGAAVAAAPHSPLRGVRILLVEDVPLNQFVARGVLEQAGAQVEVAGDGNEALQSLGIAPERFQLILMDVQMPGMDGYTATRAIRQQLGLTLPIIAMSAGVLSFERDQCRAAGMDDFVGKPLDVDQMMRCLLAHLPAAAAEARPAGHFNIAALLKNQPPAQHKMLAGVVQRMLEQIPADLAAIVTACAGDAPAACAPVLHRMRGSLGTLGAEQFTVASLELEKLVKGSDRDAICAALDQLEGCLAQTVEAARAWLESEPHFASASVPATGASAALAHFEQLLSERNIDACEALEELHDYFEREYGAEFTSEMEKHMAALQFGAALRLLQATAPQ